MPSLQAHLKSIDFSHQLIEMKNLVASAQAETTFWGGRIVKVGGFSGSISLEDLGNKVLKAGRERCDADDLTPEERIAGLEIIKILRNFYQSTDAQIRRSNPFTQFLNWIREFSFHPYTTRFHIARIAGCAKGHFRGFSDQKFFQHFGGALNAFNPAYRGSFGPPSRIMATDEAIRGLLARAI